MSARLIALLFVALGGAVLLAGLTWLLGPWTLVAGGVGLIAGGLFVVDVK